LRIRLTRDVADILVIDPSEAASRLLVPALIEDGHGARIVRTGAAGLISAREQRPDAVVLVASLPDISGAEVCRSLKADPATQGTCVVFVTSNGTDDRVSGLEVGADDSVAEPFSVREVVLRIRAILRRRDPRSTRSSATELLSIDKAAHRVLVHGRDIHVTALELRLLCALRDGAARVQSRQALLRDVWGNERGVGPRTVDTHIKRLRRKLGPAASCIRSVRGVGYGFDPASLTTPSIARASRPTTGRAARLATAART
jgi:two-component system phosphate regulon response regulator PhoB